MTLSYLKQINHPIYYHCFDETTGLLNLEEYANVGYLDCREMPVIDIINFPNELKSLECHFTNIQYLHDLPKSIEHIMCDDNTCFDALPENLKMLRCMGDKYLFDIFWFEEQFQGCNVISISEFKQTHPEKFIKPNYILK